MRNLRTTTSYQSYKQTLLVIGLMVSHLLMAPSFSQAESQAHNTVSTHYATHIIHPAIRTLRVQTLADWQLKQEGEHTLPCRPILEITPGLPIDGSDPANTLEISFDEMSHDVHFYTYTLLHLNADGMPSALNSSEYLHGFTTADIVDFEHSLNTSRAYTHYRFTFPNEDMQITASGNYALIIYEDGNPEHVVATVGLMVVDPRVGIVGNVRANTDIETNGRYQQLDIDIATANLTINTPDEIKLLIRQNGRTDNQVYNPRPTYVEPKRLRYINQRELIFEGGCEYHHFDTYSAYYSGAGVDRIGYANGDYHAQLYTDELSAQSPYMHQFDANGQRVINADRTEYDDTEAEYMWVHFFMSGTPLLFDGAVYVGGDLFENEMKAENRMQYDDEAKGYYLTSLIKQGGADYQYWWLQKGEKKATLQRTEGSHWETRNEYMVYVFYRPFGSRADQLVGVQAIQ